MSIVGFFYSQDGMGRNGLYYVIEMTCKLLDPKCSESSALNVGKLVNTLVTKVMIYSVYGYKVMNSEQVKTTE